MEILDNEFITKEMINSRQEWVLEYLYEEYYQKLRRYASFILKDSFSVDDVVQDAFMQFWYKMGNNTLEFTTLEALKNYFYVMVRGKCFGILKYSKRYINTYHEEADRDLFTDIAAADRLRTVQGLIKENKLLMPKQMRTVMIKLLLEGKRVIEIQDEMGLTKQAVMGQRQLGLNVLREYFATGKIVYANKLLKKYKARNEEKSRDRANGILSMNQNITAKTLSISLGISLTLATQFRREYLEQNDKFNMVRKILRETPNIKLRELAEKIGANTGNSAKYWKYKVLADDKRKEKQREANHRFKASLKAND